MYPNSPDNNSTPELVIYNSTPSSPSNCINNDYAADESRFLYHDPDASVYDNELAIPDMALATHEIEEIDNALATHLTDNIASDSQNLFESAEVSTTLDTVELSLFGMSLKDYNKKYFPEKNEDVNIPKINQAAASTQNPLLHSDIERTTHVNPRIYYMAKNDDDIVDFLLYCAERGENYGRQRSSIRKISRVLRDLSARSFNPQLVSIGPLHRQDQKLQEQEGLKESYLHDLLCRNTGSTPKQTLEACLRKVNGSINRIRESYADMITNYNNVELAMMMVTDGCFILEFCIKHRDEKLNLPNKMQNDHIAMDLILLENQIPFFVLQDLFDSSMGNVPFSLSDILDRYLAPYISLFRTLSPKKNSITDDISTNSSDHDHVLGYLHKRYQCVVAKSSNPVDVEPSKPAYEERIENKDIAFHSVAELDRSGVNFKHHQESNWSMTIKFQSSLFPCFPWYCGKPTILMPTLVIDDITELILRNFIAYEQSFPKDRFYFTSYACAMKMLIDTQEDVTKLVESRVLVNNLGSNQEAADMINQICKHISLTDFYYTQEFKQMDSYYNGYWPKNIARLRRTYFSSPWNAIALFAAFILFSLTVVQTVFTITAA